MTTTTKSPALVSPEGCLQVFLNLLNFSYVLPENWPQCSC